MSQVLRGGDSISQVDIGSPDLPIALYCGSDGDRRRVMAFSRYTGIVLFYGAVHCGAGPSDCRRFLIEVDEDDQNRRRLVLIAIRQDRTEGRLVVGSIDPEAVAAVEAVVTEINEWLETRHSPIS